MRRSTVKAKRGKPREPITRLEWQEAVNAAEFMLLVDAARAYGLVEGGPEIDVARAQSLLEEGKRRHVVPCQQYCRVCGCTEDDACEGGCYWVEADLCSQCAEKARRKTRKRIAD